MAAIDSPREIAFWRRELAELAEHHGSSAGEAVRNRQAAYLAAFVRTGAPSVAAGEAGISRGTVYKWAAEDPVFHQARTFATESYSDTLVAELSRRSVDGELVVVRDKFGNEIGEERKKSDYLLAFALKGLDAGSRWTQRQDVGAAKEGAWRADMVKLLATDEGRKLLEQMADLVAEEKESQ